MWLREAVVSAHRAECAWTRHLATLDAAGLDRWIVGATERTRCDCGLAARTTDGPADDDETLGLTGRESGDWR